MSREGPAVNLSLDHKASRPDEVQRIERNECKMLFGRVGGTLAITRAFGDFEFKTVFEDGKIVRKYYIISEPEISIYDYNPFIDEFIILDLDGLFENFMNL